MEISCSSDGPDLNLPNVNGKYEKENLENHISKDSVLYIATDLFIKHCITNKIVTTYSGELSDILRL
jgi:hypothetical protein